MVRFTTTLLAALLLVSSVFAQSAEKQPFPAQVNLVFGLNQPLVASGFNFEGNLFWRRFAFDYSHGISLDFGSAMVGGDFEAQHLKVHLPYSIGIGAGYRFTPALSLRLEPKWHRFEVSYEGAAFSEQAPIVSYNTFTLGLGAYYAWQPFRKADNLLKGIVVAPSVRYWPNVSSSLKDNAFNYQSLATGEAETHETLNIGVANSPWIVNVSVGYALWTGK